MSSRRAGALAALVLCAACGTCLAQDFSKVEIRTVPVAPGIFMLEGAGGNIGVSTGPDGVALIDDQFAPLTDKIRSAVSALGPGALRFVINTHWHGDHTGGNENLARAGAVLVAHDNVRRRMSTEQFQAFFDQRTPASPAAALPVITFADSVTLHWNGGEIRVIHVPHAHTDGDSLIHFVGANVLHMGDLFFHGNYPFIDVDSGGSIDGMIAGTERGLELAGPATKIIPGHGPLADRAALTTFHDMLVSVRQRIAPLVTAGQSLEQVQAAKPTAALDERWGGGFIKPDAFVAFVYHSLPR